MELGNKTRILSARSTRSDTSFRSSSGSVKSSNCKTYRTVANKPQIDEMLFGSQKNIRKKLTRQAGRDIVGNGKLTNQETDKEPILSARSSQHSNKSKLRAKANQNPGVIIRKDDLLRMKNSTTIFSASDLEDIKEMKEAEKEKLRLTAKERKAHMMKRAEECAKRAPKSEIEQIFENEKKETIRRANLLKDQNHDSVKLLRTLGARAAAFTIRDEQIKEKEKSEEEKKLYDEKMNIMMEIDRLKDLKRQEDIFEEKKQKRIHDREVLELQIADRKRKNEMLQKQIKREGDEMLEKLREEQEKDELVEKNKRQQAAKSMEEIIKFNEFAMERKQKELQIIKDEEEKIVLYQKKKAEEQKLREEEEKRRKHEAEMRCAKLRSMQEKVANQKAELDELRAKRAAESRERTSREAELAMIQKNQRETQILKQARETQALHQQRAKEKEAALQKLEYEAIMEQVRAEKAKAIEEEKVKEKERLQHRQKIQQQIEEKQNYKKKEFETVRAEGRELKNEYAEELTKLERIRKEEVSQLEESGINPLYLAEMKAIDIAKIRDC